MPFSVGPSGGPSTFVASTTLSSLGLLQALNIPVAEGLTATEVLRTTLTPIHQEVSYQARIGLSGPVLEDLGHFVERRHEEPSENLLSELTGKVSDLRALLAPAPIETYSANGPLDYPGHRAADALIREKAALRAAFQRLEAAVEARAGVVSIPPAVLLEEVLAQPERYRDKELEIAITDIDGTTRLGQLWLGWLSNVLRYGPKRSTGLGIVRLIKTIVPALTLRIQEKRNGVADPEKITAVMAKAIKGLSASRVRRSFNWFYDTFGKRHISSNMIDEFACHRAKGRLILGVSASPEYLVRRHAEDLGIPVGNFFGTTVEIDPKTGRGTGKYHLMRAEEKVTFLEEKIFSRFREKGIKFWVVNAYSDSDSDVPMLELAKKYGAIPVATNAPRERFEKEVLKKMGGTAVQEKNGWPGAEGERRTVYYSSEGGGQLVHVIKTPSVRPPFLDDLYKYGAKVAVSGVGFALASPLSTLAAEGPGAIGELGIATLTATSIAALVAGASEIFIPPQKDLVDRPASGDQADSVDQVDDNAWMRKWILRDMAPLASAVYFASGSQPFSPIAFVLSLTASTFSTRVATWMLDRVAHGFGARKLERFMGSKFSELLARPAQMTLYRLFYPFAVFLEGRYLHGG